MQSGKGVLEARDKVHGSRRRSQNMLAAAPIRTQELVDSLRPSLNLNDIYQDMHKTNIGNRGSLATAVTQKWMSA